MPLEDRAASRKPRNWVWIVPVSLAWLAAWIWIRGSFGVWVVMFIVYVFAIAVAILFAPVPGSSPAFDAWRDRFFRTGGIVVASGLLSMLYLIVIGLVFFLIGIVRG